MMYTDDFAATGPGDSDMLWIIDNSASMDDAQAQLLNSFTAFAAGLPPQSSTQLAVTTTQGWPCTEDISSEGCDDGHGTTGRTARFADNPEYLDPANPEDQERFLELADVGLYGAGDERPLQVALMAVCEALDLPPMSDFVLGIDDLRWDFPWGCSGTAWSPDHPLYEACHCLPQQVGMEFNTVDTPVELHRANKGMLRGNPLHIVIFSDEGDDTATTADFADICPHATEGNRCHCTHGEMIRLLDSVVGNLTVSVFGPGQGLYSASGERFLCNPQQSQRCLMNYHFWSANRTGGTFFPIQTSDDGTEASCSKFGMSVDLADLLLDHPSTEWFTLERKPEVSTVEVTVNGLLVPVLGEDSACTDAALGGGGGWIYDDKRRGVALTGDCTPFDGDEIQISYAADEVEIR